MHLISRPEAIAAGLKRFFTGRPCKYGHIAERKVGNSDCLECKRANENAKYADPVKREKILVRNERYRSSERGKENSVAYHKSEKRRDNHRDALARYRASPKGRAAISEYAGSPNIKKKVADQNRFKKYGLSPSEYAAMLDRQQYRCAVCRTDTPLGRGAWHVDHCHTTGVVRGLLCHHCNVGLGHFKDSSSLLVAACAYLQPFESENNHVSLIGDLFGSGSQPAAPQPTSAAPKISDAASESAANEERSRQNAKFGADKTILTSGLGDTSAGASNINRTSALGGNSSLTST